MLSGEGMQGRKTVKNINRSNQQKQLCTRSTLFLYISLPLFCFARLQRETSRNFLGPVQTSNFTCAEFNCYFSRLK